ncbi:MAG TPA: GGDEF domain-containing protein [Acidobacteriaceae bacterium]|jgi:diguanylate cyclase (GGDEF)-like protein|nr:GGDEF domain-containing protein [Acidobacteriaceae bacterium]
MDTRRRRWGQQQVRGLSLLGSRQASFLLFPLLFLLCAGFPAPARALVGPVTHPSLPVLRTARQAHTLSDAEARRNYPVHLARAQVTFYDPRLPALFVMDSTDGIFADLRGQTPPDLRAGDIVDVDAVSGPGKVNPVLMHARFRVLRHASLPDAPLVSFDRILTGAWDSHWISMEGIVRAVRRPSDLTAYAGEAGFGAQNLILTLSSGPDLIDVITETPASGDFGALIDARVRLRVAVGSRFNQRLQLIGVHVYMPDLSYVQVLDAPPPDPFAIPVTDTAGVMRRSLVAPGHRVHVRGVVTASMGRDFSLMDAKHGIFVHADRPLGVQRGDLLDVVGFPSMGDYTAILEDAIVRRIGSATPPAAVALTAAEALTGIHDAEPIQLQGQLLYISRGPREQDLVLNQNGVTFSAVLPVDAEHAPLALEPGTQLRLTGICFIQVTPDKTPEAVQLFVHSPEDVVVLERPAWWTPRHALILSALLSAAVFVFVAWNVVLRRRVREQTQVIRVQLAEAHALREQAESAHREKSASLASVMSLQRDLLSAQEKLRYQATHDALTGLRNRGALLDLLLREMERMLRTHSSTGVLMLDIDHFKPVNDTHGHLAGDGVLREFGRRLSQATRPYDVVGRYGGEEFLIILPECDSKETLASAERIRAAVGDVPFLAGGGEVKLTVSIGATVGHAGASESELLSIADAALYQAKSEGRNRTVLSTHREAMHPAPPHVLIG